MNHAITLGSFSGGRVWVEDENGSCPAEVKLRTKTRSLMGTWHDIHDKPITFDARRFHQVEPHEGHMWALAAYVPQASDGSPMKKRGKTFVPKRETKLEQNASCRFHLERKMKNKPHCQLRRRPRLGFNFFGRGGWRGGLWGCLRGCLQEYSL